MRAIGLLFSLLTLLLPLQAWAGTLTGRTYYDNDRSGSWTAGDTPMPSVVLWILDGTTGQYVKAVQADSQGLYSTTVYDGAYRVQFSSDDWWLVRMDWAPSTTASVKPIRDVTVAGTGTADFGWRKIVRSTDPAAPISAYVGPSGIRVESYNDVVAAKTLHDALAQGLLGAPAARTSVRFDLGSGTGQTVSGATLSGGVYIDYSARCNIGFEGWLDDHDLVLSHEYGHAWSQYYAYVVQQDPNLTAYLKFRGLTGDPRLNTSHAWMPGEIIAEDYRQLFGSPTARVAPQENREIPAAAQVPGLADFLLNTFATSPTGGTTPPPPAATTLDVTGLTVSPSPVTTSGTVAFSLTASATLTVEIRTASGGLVRTLVQKQAALAGPRSHLWDRKDGKGRKVKPGTYQARVEAVGPDGAVVVRTQAFPVK